MSTYILKISSSGEYVNKIQWDGSSSITISPSHSLELYDYTSSAYIPFSSESIYDTSVIQEQVNVNVFSGRLEDPILLNGKPIKRLFTDTNDGVLELISGSQGDLILDNSGSFILDDFDNTNNIFMSLYNYDLESQLYYSSSISRIIDNNITDYILNLNHELVKYSFLVKNTEITSSTSGSYLKLGVEEIYKKSNKVNETANSLTHQQLINFAWDVDFDLGDNAQVGDFYGNFYGIVSGAETGSFSGSFTGSLQGTASHALNFTGVAISALTAISSSYATFAETASKLEVFTTSSNWTKPSWAKTVKVVCVGGGGGGGGSFGVPSGQVTGGGGGAGGSVSMGEFDANLLPSSSISITVGAGGTGGGGQDGYGANGGSSMFDTLLIARGGDGGQGGTDVGGSLGYVRGGRSDGTINYLNTGGGPGGRGSVSARGITDFYNSISMTVAPSLPLNEIYVDLNWNVEGYPGERMGIPAAIAPTGGGGGLGYDADNGGNQDGMTTGGSIKPNFSLSTGAEYFYEPGGLVGKTYTYSVDGYVPAFYTKIGLGGNGGNPSASLAPSGGSRYGGGGGGAYGFYTGSYGPVSSGASGADGVVIIISEA